MKVCIFNIIEKRISFYSNNLDLLPPKLKISFRHLKQGIQQIHKQFVLAPIDKAGNNVLTVYYIKTLKSELSTAKTNELVSTDEKSVVNKHCNEITTKLNFSITESQERLEYLHFIGYRNFIKNLTKLVLSQTLAHVQLRVCIKY